MLKPSQKERKSISEVTIIGIDLAKRVFQLHGAREDGSVVFRKKLSRGQVLAFISQQPRCVVAMEACATAHGWGREFEKLGHDVRLIPPVYVKPFLKLSSPQHNFTYHQVPIMRRNVRRSANFRRSTADSRAHSELFTFQF